jgi:subtilisin family serine protease
MRRKLIAFPALIIASMAFIFAAQVTPAGPVEQTIFKTMGVQSGPTWGLDRVDGTMDGQYSYGGTGAGVRIYIVDTGVDSNHPDLRGRVIDGFDAFGDNLDQADCQGHGTHVAAVAAGKYFGVAKSATIVPVRVLDCAGVGNTETLRAGLAWVINNHPVGTAGVVNMSLGGTRDNVVNAITESVIGAGLTVVSAAGNSAADACNYSPASAAGVLAVGATDMNDTRASFSNYGSCVDIYAPGVRINSANPFNYNMAKSRSGTSQSSPFVAGAIAVAISTGGNPTPAAFGGVVQVVQPKLEPSLIEPENPPEEAEHETPAVDSTPSLESELLAEPATPPEPTPESEPTPEITPTLDPAPNPDPKSISAPVLEIDPGEPLEFPVLVTQESPGSYFGTLKWEPLDGARDYRVYKTGSIRPGWRLFWSTNSDLISRTISDKPGSISIYRVVAVFGSKEIELGSFEYIPTE